MVAEKINLHRSKDTRPFLYPPSLNPIDDQVKRQLPDAELQYWLAGVGFVVSINDAQFKASETA